MLLKKAFVIDDGAAAGDVLEVRLVRRIVDVRVRDLSIGRVSKCW